MRAPYGNTHCMPVHCHHDRDDVTRSTACATITTISKHRALATTDAALSKDGALLPPYNIPVTLVSTVCSRRTTCSPPTLSALSKDGTLRFTAIVPVPLTSTVCMVSRPTPPDDTPAHPVAPPHVLSRLTIPSTSTSSSSLPPADVPPPSSARLSSSAAGVLSATSASA